MSTATGYFDPSIAQTTQPNTGKNGQATAAPGGAVGHAFSYSVVIELAKQAAAKPFKAPSAALPKPFTDLSHDQYEAIKNKPSSRIWGDANLGFAIEALPRGFLFSSPMIINIVEDGAVKRAIFKKEDFDFGALDVPDDLPDIGFSGFRVLQTRSKPATEAAIFQGASFFRAIATGQRFGITARGLSIRTADPRGEEFPLFREVWIEQPSIATDALVIDALLDSQSVAGAYRFTIRPGDMAIVDTECILFARVAVDHFGLGGMAGAHLLGPLERRTADDVRPRVYDFSGLQMLSGRREWIWRPVSNRSTLQISSFLDRNPKGFGFIQPLRDFERFLDDANHWELRPSLWVEPIGDWGEGTVTLVEIPSQSEINQNVIAYWRPSQSLTPKVPAHFAYRQFWCWSPPRSPNLARVKTSRVGLVPGAASDRFSRRFLVEFEDEGFGDPGLGPVTATVSVAPGSVANLTTFRSPSLKTYRVVFDAKGMAGTGSELRIVLNLADKPFSETWLYRWTT